ncbi:MAG: hypothetical protein QOI63_460, partial [Thermoplasmata archaeon]|nr:hypothetical protein [Thermoplasmata archaeon]
MSWSLPVDGQYATFARLPAALLAVAVAVAVVFLWALAQGKLQRRAQGAALLALAVGSLCALLALVAAVGPGTPGWDRAASAALSPGWLKPVASALSLALSFPFALAALFALFLWPVAKGRWREAYAALLAGPGLAGLLVGLKLAWPRVPPAAQPFFAGPSAFPGDVAALVPLALALHAWLSMRLRPGRRSAWTLTAPLAVLAALLPVAAGQAWLSDSIAGLALAGLWGAVVGMAWLLEAALEAPLARVLAAVDGAMQRVVRRPLPWLLALLGLGVFLRVASYWWTPLAVDAFSYGVMGESFLRHGTFTMPWGDVDTFRTAAVPSHHYPPLYPVYLAGFYKLLGFSQSSTHVAAIVSSLAALFVTWLCTRDLYGQRKALVVVAVVAVSPILVQNTGQGYSENLVLLLFVATLWAILKSLEKPWYILPAGILAGLGYLTKSSMGYFFV